MFDLSKSKTRDLSWMFPFIDGTKLRFGFLKKSKSKVEEVFRNANIDELKTP